jgi:hypothetical protein
MLGFAMNLRGIHTRVILGAYDRWERGGDMRPEETIREALERLKVIPSRHGGVPTYPAFAALDALVKERDELRELLAARADRDDLEEAERDRSVLVLRDEDSSAGGRSATTSKDLDESLPPPGSRPASPRPP